jgi:hypothetical protein
MSLLKTIISQLNVLNLYSDGTKKDKLLPKLNNLEQIA